MEKLSGLRRGYYDAPLYSAVCRVPILGSLRGRILSIDFYALVNQLGVALIIAIIYAIIKATPMERKR